MKDYPMERKMAQFAEAAKVVMELVESDSYGEVVIKVVNGFCVSASMTTTRKLDVDLTKNPK